MSACSDLILELDRLIRSDRSALVPSKIQSRRGMNEGCYTSCHVSSSNDSFHGSSQCQGSFDGFDDLKGISRAGSNDWADASPDSSCGKDDMRQVRLFKTRFCQYGTDCPYLAKGTCLYAHSRDEVRFRPPPPKGYKAPSVAGRPSFDSSRESVWSSSILDCLPSVV